MTRGAVVLTPFPFTDLTGRKVRPALIVSRSDRPGADVILAFITTWHGQASQDSDLLIADTEQAFAETGLKVSSVVKLDKLVTVRRDLLLGELGHLSEEMMAEVDMRLRYALEL